MSTLRTTIVTGAVAALVLAGSADALADLVFFDDFEDDTTDANPMTPLVGSPWVNIGTLTGHTVQPNPLVNTDNPSTKALRSHRTGEPPGRAFIDLTFEQTERIAAGELLIYRVKHYQPDPLRPSVSLAVYQNNFHDFSENPFVLKFDVNRELKHFRNSLNDFESTGLFGTESWDDVEIVVDFATDTWSVSLNGGTPVGSLPFRNDGDYMTAASLIISPSVAHQTGYTDDVAVYIGEVDEPMTSADFDEDADVDGSDLLRWQRGLGITTGALLGQGDADGSGSVDVADLGVWRSQFGPGVTSAVAAIPEPTLSALLPAAMGATIRLRNRSTAA